MSRMLTIFTEITRWIAEHREHHNIRFVLQLGDLVEHNTTAEWDRARTSMAELDGKVPYALTTGNHDLGPGGKASDRTGEFNLASRFGAGSPYASQPTMGGFYPEIATLTTEKVLTILSMRTVTTTSCWRLSGRRATRLWLGRTRSSQSIRSTV